MKTNNYVSAIRIYMLLFLSSCPFFPQNFGIDLEPVWIKVADSFGEVDREHGIASVKCTEFLDGCML